MSQKAVPEALAHPKAHLCYHEERFYIFCPGCYLDYQKRYPHDERFWINGALHAFNTTWQFNRDLERPTIYPSLLCQYSEGDKPFVCHSFVTDGRIRFLNDSTHPLAGQTVDLLDVPETFLHPTFLEEATS